MKNVFRLITVLLCAIILFTAFAGCAKQTKPASSESSGEEAAVAKISGEWKHVIDESENIFLGYSFDNDGGFSRFIEFNGEKAVLNNATYEYVFGDANSESGMINIYKNEATDYYPGVAKRADFGDYRLTTSKSDMMIHSGIDSGDIVISKKLDEAGLDALEEGDIITFSLIDEKVDGTLMANTHKIAKIVTKNGEKVFIVEYPYEFYGKIKDEITADRVLGKYVCCVKYDGSNNRNLGEFRYEINDGELKLLRILYDFEEILTRG